MDWGQLAIEVVALATAVAGNRKLRRADNGVMLDKSKANREEADKKRANFEAQQVATLVTEAQSTRRAIAELTTRIGDVERTSGHLQGEMHALQGRIDAANDTYQEMLLAVRGRVPTATGDSPKTEVIQTPGGNRLVRNKKG